MKKAVIVVDHKDRDLRGLVLIGYHLYTKFGVFPYFTTTKNEISSLIKYKPDLILVQHVRHHRQQEFLDYAKEKNIKVAILLAEGFPMSAEGTERDINFSLGLPQFLKYLDLVLTWGPGLANDCNRNAKNYNYKAIAVGSPRFDYHTPKFDSLCLTREEFCNRLSLDSGKKIVSWMSNCTYANHEIGLEALIKQIQTPGNSDHIISEIIGPLARDHQRVYDSLSKNFKELAKGNSDINFVIKVHPSENIKVYQREFEDIKNIKVFQNLEKVSLSDFIRHSDVQINWRCTTSSEAWLMNIKKPVIGFEPDSLETDFFKYLSSGCHIVKDLNDLQAVLPFYLNGGSPTNEIIEKRKKFIEYFLFSDDGCSSERCAKAINDLIVNSENKGRVITPKSSMIYLKYLKNYRFNKNWMAMVRQKDHPKYIPPELLDKEVRLLEKVLGSKSEYIYL